LTISGGMPCAAPKLVTLSEDAVEMLRADPQNENETIRAYRQRVLQCDAQCEYGIAEDIRKNPHQEQEHQIDLATALGEHPPGLSSRR
jgi:bacterioferritin